MDKETVSTIAHLSRLSLENEKGDKLISDLEEILEFVDQLNDANTENVDPLSSPLEMTARLRNDDLNSKDRKSKFLSNAPDANEDYFLVPRVVE
tara:strand:- start:1115 stop:1396 length:282 start_codon:yes stop_codon:yes gene_type:complete